MLFSKSFAQTNDELFKSGFNAFVKLYDFSETLKNDSNAVKNLIRLRTMVDSTVAILTMVANDSSSDAAKLARYYITVSKFEFAAGLFNANEQTNSYNHLLLLEDDFIKYNAAYFPVGYNAHKQYYEVNWDNFGPVSAHYFTMMGELNYNLESFTEAEMYFKKVLINEQADAWQQYTCADLLMKIKLKRSEYDSAFADYIVGFIEANSRLSQYELAYIDSMDYDNALTALSYLDSVYSANPQTPDRNNNFARIIKPLYSLGYKNQVITIASRLLNENYSEYSFHFNCVTIAVNENDSAFAKLSADKTSAFISDSSCAMMDVISKAYETAGDSIKKKQYSEKFKKCTGKYINTDFIKQSDLIFYAGVYLSGFVRKEPGKLCPGISTALLYKRIGLEFTYLQVFNRTDFSADNDILWNGNKMRMQLMLLGGAKRDNDSRGYFGFIFGIGHKNFHDYTADVTEIHGSTFSYNFTDMKDKQFEYMINYGRLFLDKGVGGDISFALGFSYNMFDKNSTGEYFNNSDYVIEDNFFDTRKENYFLIQAAIRLSIGFNIGIRH